MADGDVTLRYNLVGRDQGANKAFKELGQNVDHLHTRMVAVGTAIGNLASGGIMALGGMAAGAVKTGIQTAAAMQQAQLGFATLLGSERAAGDYMKWLTGFAAATPFELKGLVESSRTLIGVGVSASDAKVMLQNFGDTASAIGIDQDAFQRVMLATSQAISAGKFQAGDLNQIMTNGIPVWTILSKAMHKTVPELRDLASHGKLLSKDVLPALQAEMHKDYGGAMAKQSQTLNGLWSTFQDTLNLGMASVLKPLIPIMQKVLPGAMATLGTAFQAGATAVQGFVSGGGLATLGSLLTDKVIPALKFVGDHATVFTTLAASAATGVATYKAYTLVMGIFTAVTTAAAIAQKLYAVATREATVAQVGLDVAMDANPIGLIVGLVAALVAGLVWLAFHTDAVRTAFTTTWSAISGLVASAIPKVIAAVMAMVAGIKAAWSALPGIISAVVGWFQALPGRIMSGIAALPGLVLGLIKSMFEKLAFAVGFSLGMLFNLFFVWPGKVGQALAALPGIILHWITTSGVRAVAAWLDFNNALVAKAYALTGQLISWVAALIPRVVAWFARLPGLVVAALRALPGQIKAVFAAAGTWLLDAGRQIIAGLVNGIKNAVGAAISAVKDLGGNLISGFKSAVGISSPAKKMIPLGHEVINGIEVGLRERAPRVYTMLEEFAQRIGNIKVTAGMKNMLEKLAVNTAADMRAATAKFDKVKDAIKDQQAKVADLIKARADYANTLASGLTGGGPIAGIQLAQDTTDEEGNVTKADQVGGFVASLKAKADAIKKFGTDIAALRGKGLSAAVLQQIEQSGLETGGALAAALATATPAAITQINSLSKSITTTSDQMGKAWAGQMYDTGIKAAEGILKGLKSREAAILAMIRQLALNIVAEIKHTLKIKSPSAVMQDEVGAMIPAGLVAGIQAGAGGVAAAMRSLVAVPGTGAQIGLGAGIAATGGGAGVTNIHLHVPNGFVGSPDQLATALSDVISRAKARGLNLSFA